MQPPPPPKKSTNFPPISIKTRTSKIPNRRKYLDIPRNSSTKCDSPYAFRSLWYLVIICWYLEWQFSLDCKWYSRLAFVVQIESRLQSECRVYSKVFAICILVYMGRRKYNPPPPKMHEFPIYRISIKTRTSRIPSGRKYLDIPRNSSTKCDSPHAFRSLWYLVIICWYLEWQFSLDCKWYSWLAFVVQIESRFQSDRHCKG